MKIFSKTHSIAASAESAVVTPKGENGKPLSKTLIVQHPAGTVLDLPDEIAEDLVYRNFAVEYKDDEHKAEDGKVAVATVQRVAPPLPEGFTQPVLTRLDGTENDGTPAAPKADGPVVLRDTKNDAQVEKDKEVIAAANAARVVVPARPAA